MRRAAGTRGAARVAAEAELPGLPPEFLTKASGVADEVILEPAPATRGGGTAAPTLDITSDAGPGQTAMLAIRHPSGALTFHAPVQSVSRGVRGPSQVRFQVALRRGPATRGLAGSAIKAIVIKVAKLGADKAVSLLLPRLAEALERRIWKSRGLKEGWLKVSQHTLAAGTLEAAAPVSPARTLLLIHGTFSNTASAFRDLAASDFFDRVKGVYDDRIFAFDHFTLSRTPEQNARMLLERLPGHATTFDVITHSRGGLVLRNLVERGNEFGDLAGRFSVGRAVLVASPNDGTPLATAARWEGTVGWMANLLEMFPDNPFTTGAAFVADGIVWLANHASGDIPGLHAMDADGDPISTIQRPPGPPPGAYAALVANYQPTGQTLQRLVDIGIDQFFGSANDLVVPTEGGWRVDRTTTGLIPGSRIGCFGPGGNLASDSVTHVNFFSHPAAVDFLVHALLGRPQPLDAVDPRKTLPDRRLLRSGMSDAPAARLAVAGAAEAPPPAAADALRITVTNGDLTFEPQALLLGHYHATHLTGTESIMDRLIGGAMTRSLQRGVYPVAVGSHQVFINSQPNLDRGSFMPRPKAVIVVGLGDEGKLCADDLVQSVRQGVIAWAQRLAEGSTRSSGVFELSATLLGSGGAGITPGDAARLIAQGVSEANRRLQADVPARERTPRVGRLHLIELYLDRASEAWRSLKMQEAATPGRYAVDEAVLRGTGPLERPPDSGYRGTDFDFISVQATQDRNGAPAIAYTLDTRRARSEVRGQRAQNRLLTELVATASNDQNRDQQIGRTLFSLLVPVELEPYLAGSGAMQIQLDPQTAKIPWELLDTTGAGETDIPWAIRVKLLRKLRIQEFRERVTDATPDASALVVGEPECPPEYPRLFGARREAIAVRDCLTTDGGVTVTDLISDDPAAPGANARAVVNAVFERPWRIVHIAGHGVPGDAGSAGGVVLSNGTFLGPGEIRNMRTVPELVFVNCCHLGSADAGELLNTRFDRAEFASGVAGALIEIGVRCVVAAGWAVDDDAATVFAEEFYRSLLRGERFITAVGAARAAARERAPDVNTWGAYQCYGDPDWVFRRAPEDPNQVTAARAEDFSGVASATALRLALQRIIVQTRFQGADVAGQIGSLSRLEKLFAARWGSIGRIAELFGEAFVEAGDVETGMAWYERAVAASDGKASMRAAEQLANVRARLAWEIVDRGVRDLVAVRMRERSPGTTRARGAARRARTEAGHSLKKTIARADGLIRQALDLLDKLVAIQPTLERFSVIGSAYKRRALVNGAAGRRARVRRDLQQMRASYHAARRIGEESGADDLYYPAANLLAADVALNAGTPQWRTLDRETVAIVRKSLRARRLHDPSFWSVVGETEVDQYEAMAGRRLARASTQLIRAYNDLHTRVTATRMWASVYDTACLVLPNYAGRATGRERTAALELLALLRRYAHPEEHRDAD